jgi:hypothetical protein
MRGKTPMPLGTAQGRVPSGQLEMARGFFVWNSEVGDKTLGLGFFLFDSRR